MFKKKKEEPEFNEEVYEQVFEDEESDIEASGMEASMEVQKELQEIEDAEAGVAPTPEDNPTVLKFLNEVLDADDRLKTAFLNNQELGLPTFPVRFWLNLHRYFQVVHKYPIIADYCKNKALITTDTSLSRDGFITSLSVTQKRVRERKTGFDSKMLK